MCHCKLTENPKNENQDTRHHHDLNIVLLHAHITWKEVRSNSKRKKSTNMERKNQKYIMCKNEKYFEQNSPRFSCAKTTRESRSKELKEDDHHHSHPQRRPRVQGAPAWRRKCHLLSDIVFLVFRFCCFMIKCCLVDDDVPLSVRREPAEGGDLPHHQHTP